MVLLGALGIALAALGAGRGDRRVHELMEQTHEGRRSPYRLLRQAVEGPGATWPALDQIAANFEPMCRALTASPDAEIKGSADGYVEAVRAIATAVRRRDAKGVRAGFADLKASCGDCHYQGGVGGMLETEDEDEAKDGRPEAGRERGRTGPGRGERDDD